LKTNNHLWDVQEVGMAINMTPEEEMELKTNLPEGI
jgi:hypothetical protein